MLDTDRLGVLSLQDVRRAMPSSIADEHLLEVFSALDVNSDERVSYSDFLAAMLGTKIVLRDHHMEAAFRRFDASGSGFLSTLGLQQLLGDRFAGTKVGDVLEEETLNESGMLSRAKFFACMDHCRDSAASESVLPMSPTSLKEAVRSQVVTPLRKRRRISSRGGA